MKRTALIVAALAVFGLTIGAAYVGSDSQASAATGHATLVKHGHYGHYGHHHGLRYGYSLRPRVSYHHGWGYGHGYAYPRVRAYQYGAYAYPHHTYYRAPYVAYPHYGYAHGCY